MLVGMTYSEGNTYRPINVWDIYTRDTKNSPWRRLRTTERDETDLVSEWNRQTGWQAYSISQRAVSV